MWSVWLVFCDCGFHSVFSLMDKDKRLVEASWWERLTEGETGSCSNGRGHAQYIFSAIFLLMGRAVFPSCCLAWGQTVDPHLHNRLLDTHRQAWLSLLWGHCSFLLAPGLLAQGFVCALQGPVSPVCGSSVIKSHCPPKSNSLRVLSPFAGYPGWEICFGS